MPIVAYWGLSALATGLGIKFIGDGVEDGAKGLKDVAIVAGIGAGVYLIAKKQGVI